MILVRLVFAFLIAVCAGQAHSHAVSASRVDIKVAPDSRHVALDVDLPIRDLALLFPLDANRDDRVTWGELLANRTRVEDHVAATLRLTTDSGRCALSPEHFAVRQYDDGAFLALGFEATCADADALQLHFDVFRRNDPGHRAWVNFADTKGSTSRVLEDLPVRFDTRVERSSMAVDYVRQGIHHIFIGYDHLAFLLCLLLPAALVREAGNWKPAQDMRAALRRVIWTVTAFTVAHSITLSLAALGWVRPASALVEATIAASVIVVALHNLRPVISDRPWLLSFGFGLVHGFGFAGALGELGIPDGSRLLALAGFNLGVEAGQLAIVALALPVLGLASRYRGYARWAMPAASIGVAIVAAGWLWERL